MTKNADLPIWKENLISGYHEFRSGGFTQQKNEYSKLGAEGQSPKTMVISCVDSRVNPTDIFSAYPGELLTLRNVANLVPPFDDQKKINSAAAAIEFAVEILKVDAIVVMGHESCGGVAAYLKGLGETRETEFIGPWIKLLDKAHERFENSDKSHKKCNSVSQIEMEFAGVLQSLDNLLTFPFVKLAVKEGRLSLLGAYFSIIQGKLMFADSNGKFKEVPTKA